jgi:hypothetical protein
MPVGDELSTSHSRGAEDDALRTTASEPRLLPHRYARIPHFWARGVIISGSRWAIEAACASWYAERRAVRHHRDVCHLTLRQVAAVVHGHSEVEVQTLGHTPRGTIRTIRRLGFAVRYDTRQEPGAPIRTFLELTMDCLSYISFRVPPDKKP